MQVGWLTWVERWARGVFCARVVSLNAGHRLARWLALSAFFALTGASHAADLRKLPPAPEVQPYRQQLEALIEKRYPELLTQKITGTVMVTVLFEADGALIDTAFEIAPNDSQSLTASETQFARFGLSAGDLRYLGESRIQTPLNTVLVVFGGRDSHTLDRALIERYFPDVLSQGVAQQMGIWILLDHEGRVLRTGEEAFDSSALKTVLETRYPGIRTAEMTTSPVLARDGKPVTNSAGEALRLHCVWLAPGSPTPGEP